MYQPRYLAYCKEHGNTPENQLAQDGNTYPGGRMTGFMLWISKQKRAFKQASPQSFLHGDIADQKAFDLFLGIL